MTLLGVLVQLILASRLLAQPVTPTAPEEQLREAARLRSLALADMEDGDYANAARQLERLAELLPDNLLPPIDLAICYLRLDRRDEALAQILRARRLSPDNPQLLFTLAVLLETGDEKVLWRDVIDEFIAAHPADPRPHFLLGRRAEDEGDWAAAQSAMEETSRRAPENLVPLVELLATAAQNDDLDATEEALYGIEDRLNGFEGSADRLAREIEDALLESSADTASRIRPLAMGLRNVLRPIELYQVGLVPLIGRQGGLELFPQIDFEPPLPPSIQGGQDPDLTFERQSPFAGTTARALWVARAGEQELLLVTGDGDTLRWKEASPPTPLSVPGFDSAARDLLALDVDQDENTDLVTLSPAALSLHPGDGTGGFGAARVLVASPRASDRVFPLDPDHDGDLDLLLAADSGPVIYLRNDGNGPDGVGFSDRTVELGLAGEGTTGLRDAVVLDFDDDGDLDLLTVTADGVRLWSNERSGPLLDRSDRLGETDLSGSRVGVAEDFDRDGLFDLLLSSTDGVTYLGNDGGRFVPRAAPALAGGFRSASAADLDNDGDRDVVVRTGGQLVLLRNRGGELVPEPLAELSAPAFGSSPLPFDADLDGDLDLVDVSGDGSLALYENDGGNRNAWVRISLQGLNDNNAKNNTQGLFSRIETRFGDAFQVGQGNGGVNHIGLGARRQADVIRVVWTNGLAQTWQQVSAEHTLVERQVLKGSCPFLYTWDGREFTFVTDLMWRSTLGMHFPDGSPMPHQSARDWVRIPGEALAAGREAWLQVTAELWETIYLDRQRLVAVDYPAREARGREVELWVDERFTPPPYPVEAPLVWSTAPLTPSAATLLRADAPPQDVREALQARDGVRVDALPLTRYQGVTEEWTLELEFERSGPPEGPPTLLLFGWIFPTDTTINRALEQNPYLDAAPPRLEARLPDGRFVTVLPSIGIPNGKRKSLAIELQGLPPEARDAERLTLRLVSTMQIYWDGAALLTATPLWTEATGAPRTTSLDPNFADLHYRGFSRLYRESPTGPHLFDASEPSFERPFRDMSGSYTRYGDVLALTLAEDDRMVVMAQGDTLLLRYPTASLPPLPDGWKRTWLLYTDGWVKDADLATETSQTVEPLPHHGLRAYPDPTSPFPETTAHRDWLERYQTRQLDDQAFRHRLHSRP